MMKSGIVLSLLGVGVIYAGVNLLL
jgi:hypothetical protein